MYVLNNALNISVAKVTDDLLLAGNRESIEKFSDEVSSRFSTRKIIIDEPILFNGCRISEVTDGFVLLDMRSYLTEVSYISLAKNRKKKL